MLRGTYSLRFAGAHRFDGSTTDLQGWIFLRIGPARYLQAPTRHATRCAPNPSVGWWVVGIDGEVASHR